MFSPDKLRWKLEMQGYSCSIDTGVVKIQRWLRFTPMVNTIWLLTGMILTSPLILVLFSLASMLGAGMKYHPFDLVYNHGIRYLTGTPPLPANPVPRRFSMGLVSVWSAGVAVLFTFDYFLAGYLLGAVPVLAGLTMTLTHFCLGSWIYRYLYLVAEWVSTLRSKYGRSRKEYESV